MKIGAGGMIAISLAATFASAPANSQQQPSDSRIHIVDYVSDQIVPLSGSPGFQTTIELAPDETVQTVAVGDSSAWAVTVERSGGRIYVKPARSAAATNMTVVTNARRYLFELGADQGAAPYILRFRYAPRTSLAPVEPGRAVGRYRLSGERVLRPKAIYDDGVHTFIEWPPEAALPAVFTIDRLGRESVINGAMRGQFYTLDGVSDTLIFRIDRHVARAERRRGRH